MPYHDANRYQNRGSTPYSNPLYPPTSYSRNPTPWIPRRSGSPREFNQTPGLQRRDATPGQRDMPGQMIKREDEPRRTSFRTRAYHANEEDAHHSDHVNDINYEAYEQGFYEGQNVAYWTQEAAQEEQQTYEQEDTTVREENDPVLGLEHTDAHITTIKDVSCRVCRETFTSRNKLHNHLKLSPCLSKEATAPARSMPKPKDDSEPRSSPRHDGKVVKSAADGAKGDGFGFRGWHYATVEARLCTPSGLDYAICLDTGCTMSLIDRTFLTEAAPDIPTRRMASPISVRGLGTTNHNTNEYVLLRIYIPGLDGRLALIERELHVVDDLRAKVLIGIDVLGPEGIILDMGRRIATIYSCDAIQAALTIIPRTNQRLRRAIISQQATVIPPRTIAKIPIRRPENLPQDRDLLFQPSYNSTTKKLQKTGAIYAHIVDCNMTHIQIQNYSNNSINIPMNTRLGTLMEYDADGCYQVDPEAHSVATTHHDSESDAGRRREAVPLLRAVTKDDNNPSKTEMKLPNGITIYGSPKDVQELAKVMDEIPELWIDKGQARIPEEEWMSIPLVDNWEQKYKPGGAKVYPVGAKDRAQIDADFDKLHEQGRMSWSSKATPFSFPCFVVWRTNADGTTKGRTVVDIRALNQISVPDAYPVPSQEDILACISGATHISTIDATSFFYQWPVRRDHRNRLAVVSHREQEIFNVAVMGYRNSPAYVQRRIDTILRPCRDYARAYVDDIVIFSRSLHEHIEHLRNVFKIFHSYNISLKPNKAYVGYPSVQLLGQHVDGFGMSTSTEKLKAITSIEFPKTLKALETYLGMTGYLRHYIQFYAQIADPLQHRKTALNKALREQRAVTADGSKKKRMVAATVMAVSAPSPSELDAFHHLQSLFAQPTTLTHFVPTRQLFMDIDASKDWGFGVMIFHSKGEKIPPSAASVEPILFLSKMLTDGEKRYWLTELEIACFVWAVRKVRHMIEAAEQPTIIYTDHSATLSIARQTTLTTSSTDKLNLRLIRASQYLSQFRLDVRHKAGKLHFVPDALSRLQARKDRAMTETEQEASALDALNTYVYPVTTHIELNESFKNRLQEGYTQDPRWDRIKDQLEVNELLGSNASHLPFLINNGLIYYQDTTDTTTERRRLCIPDHDNLIKEVFELAHDEAGHPGYARTHERIIQTLFIQRLSQKLHENLRHCPKCRINQTPRHKPYGVLQPIFTPLEPCHTITIDFILALPRSSPEEYDCLLTVTDKFSKKLALIPGRETYKAKDWAIALLDRLMIADWGLPKAIVSDHDPKFLSELWRTWFSKLNVQLLTSTSYHPQTDGQSERTNQTVEIALRYYLSTMEDPNQWPRAIPLAQARINNSITITGRSPNEIVHSFRNREPIDLVLPVGMERRKNTDETENPPPYAIPRIDAADAMALATMEQKRYYDGRHTASFLEEGDKAYLRLHRGYSVPGVRSKKTNQQPLGPFTVRRRVG